MALRAHPEQHEIEKWKLARFQHETRVQLLLVLLGRLRGIPLLTLDAMYLLRIHWGFGEHRFRGHAKVALCIIRRYVPLIPEEKLDLAPRHFRLQQRVVCQQSVQCFRRGTTRQRYAETALFSPALPP